MTCQLRMEPGIPHRPAILRLPIEMQSHILNYLPLEDKKSARLVCDQWNSIIDRLLRFKVCLTQQDLKFFKNFPNSVNSVRMGNLPKLLQLSPQDRKILSEANYLELANLHNFKMEIPANISENVEIILKSCSNISKLQVTGEFLDSVVLSAPLALHKINLMNLTSIMINLDDVKESTVLLAFGSLYAPNLTTIEFHRSSLCHCCGHLFDLDTFSAIYHFIKTHEKKLKILRMNNTIAAVVRLFMYNPLRRLRKRFVGPPTRRGLQVLNVLPVHDLPFHPLTDLKLEALEINHPAETFGSNWDLAFAIISHQKSLKDLKVVIKYFHFYRELMELIRQNTFLIKLEIDQRVAVFGFHVPLLLDIENIQNCTNLHELRISSSYTPLNISGLPKTIKILHWSGRLGYTQVHYIASNLEKLEQVTFNHVFIDRPLDRYPNQGPRINAAYFDVDLFLAFRQLSHLISLRLCDCDIRHYLQALENRCKCDMHVNLRKGHPAKRTSADFEPCCRINSDLCTFTFTHL